MKRAFAFWTVAVMCMAVFSSCECGKEEEAAVLPSSRSIVVNGVNYKTAATSLSTKSGLNFEATTINDELTVNLVMNEGELNKEYDLNSSVNAGGKYIQILFSKSEMDSYSVAMMGPNTLNVIKEWGASEQRELKNATAKITKNDDGTYSVLINAEGDGLTFLMDFSGEIDQVK